MTIDYICISWTRWRGLIYMIFSSRAPSPVGVMQCSFFKGWPLLGGCRDYFLQFYFILWYSRFPHLVSFPFHQQESKGCLCLTFNLFTSSFPQLLPVSIQVHSYSEFLSIWILDSLSVFFILRIDLLFLTVTSLFLVGGEGCGAPHMAFRILVPWPGIDTLLLHHSGRCRVVTTRTAREFLL